MPNHPELLDDGVYQYIDRGWHAQSAGLELGTGWDACLGMVLTGLVIIATADFSDPERGYERVNECIEVGVGLALIDVIDRRPTALKWRVSLSRRCFSS